MLEGKIVLPLEVDSQVYVMLFQVARSEGKDVNRVVDEAVTQYLQNKQPSGGRQRQPGSRESSDGGTVPGTEEDED